MEIMVTNYTIVVYDKSKLINEIVNKELLLFTWEKKLNLTHWGMDILCAKTALYR